MGKIIAIFNQKGGVGKTSTINNLAFELQARGKKVLMVDADQQENLSVSVGVYPKQCKRTLYDVIVDEIDGIPYKKDLSDVIVHAVGGCSIIPGSVEMASIDEKMYSVTKIDTPLELWLKQYQKDAELQEQVRERGEEQDFDFKAEIDRYIKLTAGYRNVQYELISSLIEEGFLDEHALPPEKEKDGKYILKRILSGVIDDYDFILIDCPPALSATSKAALNAASSVLVPMTLEPFSASGLSHLIASVNTIRQLTNPRLRFSGLVYTMVDDRLVLSKDIKDQADFYKQFLYIYNVQIPRSTDVNKAFAERMPLLEFSKNNIARLAYSKFTDEFLEREG